MGCGWGCLSHIAGATMALKFYVQIHLCEVPNLSTEMQKLVHSIGKQNLQTGLFLNSNFFFFWDSSSVNTHWWLLKVLHQMDHFQVQIFSRMSRWVRSYDSLWGKIKALSFVKQLSYRVYLPFWCCSLFKNRNSSWSHHKHPNINIKMTAIFIFLRAVFPQAMASHILSTHFSIKHGK